MNYASMMDMVLFNITAFAGCYYLVLHFTKKDGITKQYFLLLCFTVAIYYVIAIGINNATSTQSGIMRQKGKFFCPAIVAIWFSCFKFNLLVLKNNALKKILHSLLLIFIICGMFLNEYIKVAEIINKNPSGV